MVITITAAGNTEIDTFGIAEENMANANVSISPQVGSFVAGALFSGSTACTEGADYTSIFSGSIGGGDVVAEYRTANAPGGSITVNFLHGGSEDTALVAVAIKELASQNAPRSMHYALEGMR